MDIFLKFLGALVCALVILLVVLVLFIRYAIKRVAKSIGEGLAEGLSLDGASFAAILPPRIHLTAESGPRWQDQAAADRCITALRDLGFEPGGHYAMAEMPNLHLQAWCKPAESVYAVIYEQPNPGLWMDYVTLYQDGGSITVTNSPSGHQLDHRPGHDKIYEAGLDPTALYRRMMNERPQRDFVAVTGDTFVERFERAYADEMDWRNSRGGATEDEIRRIAASSGTTLTDGDVAARRAANLWQACEALDVALREHFLRSSPMSAAEWEELRERIVFIHDVLTPEMVAERLAAYRDFDGDEDEEEDEGDTVTRAHGLAARDAFRMFNMELEPHQRFEKIGELTEPLATDVYRAPAL